MTVQPPTRRLGLWLVGARGNVAVTLAAGVAALVRGVTESIGLTTEAGPLRGLGFVEFDQIVLGGHDIGDRNPADVLDRIAGVDRAFLPDVREQIHGELLRYGKGIREGTTTGRELGRITADIQSFAFDNNLTCVVVVNLSSTEATATELPTKESALRDAIATDQLPTSCIYALAAMDAGAAYVNFTPSTGATGDVFNQIALDKAVVHAGRDGKTGETLLKAALLPMFAARNLRVESWFGQNILGNGDGKSLQDPERKKAKQATKAGLVEGILGYQPDAHVGIDYVEPLGDWKVAWDHIMFRGFLGTQMNLQLTWHGADSILAAPLVLDLARICEFSMRRGDSGLLSELGFFFKEPLGSSKHALMAQYGELLHFLGAV